MPASPRRSEQTEQLKALLDIAKALTSERDFGRLLALIVDAAARVVAADRGSLFLVDPDTGELWSKVAQGMGASEIRIPRGTGIAGAVAIRGEVVNLSDAYADSRFNPAVDRSTGYSTRNMLCVPMRNTHGDIVGVLQLLNKHEGSFDADDEELLMALGGQAAAAVENALLHEDITNLFEGFVQASVVAIESRDPTTAGHSERVARLTMELADALEHVGTPSWRGLQFSAAQRLEMRYAALLHDFGKVGVREDVLTKANKLQPLQRELLRSRFDYAKRSLEVQHLRRCMGLLQKGAQLGDLREQDLWFERQVQQLELMWQVVETCNRPTVLPADVPDKLRQLLAHTYRGPDDRDLPLLTSDECELLSIPRGSLSSPERAEIERHVSHTFRFLSQIPWSRGLRRVPEIAHGHHERLSGTGYPLGLQGREICLEARIMAVADIYDALTAADRPYKRAVPHPDALKILRDEADMGHIDRELVELFDHEEVARKAVARESRGDEGASGLC